MGVGVVRHADKNSPLTAARGMALCATLAPSNTISVFGGVCSSAAASPIMALSRACEARRRVAAIHHWQKHREVTAAIEIVIVMPAMWSPGRS